MKNKRILIVDDEPDLCDILRFNLEAAGYEVLTAHSADEAISSMGNGQDCGGPSGYAPPDLLLLDVMLPGLDGFAIAKRIRATPVLAATRIVMLTARTASEDIVRGLDAGADDYVTKPFDRKVLLARVNAVLRRGLPVTEGMDFDGLRIDEASRTATLRKKALDLTPGEFDLLVRLVAHRGRVFQRPADERTVDVQVAKLRQKLGGWSDHIETIRGVGYRIKV